MVVGPIATAYGSTRGASRALPTGATAASGQGCRNPQDIITRDNVSLEVNAVIYYRAMDPVKAVIEVENYMYATSQLAQTTLRSVCGQAELDELLSEREKINMRLQEILDTQTDPWGIKVSTVEVKQIDLPPEMQRAMAKQAEAERERRAHR